MDVYCGQGVEGEGGGGYLVPPHLGGILGSIQYVLLMSTFRKM